MREGQPHLSTSALYHLIPNSKLFLFFVDIVFYAGKRAHFCLLNYEKPVIF